MPLRHVPSRCRATKIARLYRALVYDGTDYRAIIDIDDTQEITAFEHILKKFSHLGLDS